MASIRRQSEDLEREKQNLSLEQTSREETFRSELEQLAAEKEYEQKNHQKINSTSSTSSAFWQQRFNEECDRLRDQTAQLQREYDEQTRSFSDRLETAASQNSEYIQVLTRKIFFENKFEFSDGIFFKQNPHKKSMN